MLALFAPFALAFAQDVQVTLRVDFGALQRAPIEKQVSLPRGSNVVDATRKVAEVEQDWLCCSKDDVWAIDGVGPDTRLDRYWMWKLDGRMGPNFPVKHVLSEGERIEWVYSGGNQPVKLEARAVSLLPAATEIAVAIGAERALVGVSHLCRVPPGLDVPRVMSTTVDSDAWSMGRIDTFLREAVARGESLYQLDEERIRALAPTVILSQGLCPVCAVTPGDVEKSLGKEKCAELLVLSPRSLSDVAQNIRDVGQRLGRESAATIAAREFERRLEKLRALPAPSPKPRVLVLEWFEPLWVSGEWVAEQVEVAGGLPLLAGAKDPSRRVEWTDVVAADPDVIVLAACSMSVARAQRELGA
ncbi:MAG: ABC transporter substrate-binding protein, partial [Planctomycetaceae bacterium]|nr:ABC transporter substrate-binding protein [Planctomycetaceae bacterium]